MDSWSDHCSFTCEKDSIQRERKMISTALIWILVIVLAYLVAEYQKKKHGRYVEGEK